MVFPLILGALASIGATIGSAVATVGTAVSSFAATMAPTLGGILTTLKTYAEPLARFANILLQVLEILKPGEKIEDLGERALQGAKQGINMDKYSDFCDYIKALREDVKLDPVISAQRGAAEKLIAGLGLATVGVEDQFNAQRGSLNALWLLPLTNPGYFTPERMQAWLATGKLGGDILAYLEKRQSGGEARSFEKGLEVGGDGKPMNESELDQLYGALDGSREAWAEIAQKIKDSDNTSKGE